jgi:hypothetical protein
VAAIFQGKSFILIAATMRVGLIQVLGVMGRLMRFVALLLGWVAVAAPLYAGGSAADVVSRIYRDFAWEAVVASPNGPGLAQQPRGVLLNYFTPELANALVADNACTTRRHEICALDFMPLWASQDPAAEDLRVAQTTSPGQVTVRYSSPSTGAVISLNYRVVQTKAGWRIAHIVYPSGDSLAHLLSGRTR